jgi:hypothetical protein
MAKAQDLRFILQLSRERVMFEMRTSSILPVKKSELLPLIARDHMMGSRRDQLM